MEDKELYEILQKYADDTRGNKDTAFKKLNQKSQEEVKLSRKRFKPQYIFAMAVCVIAIVLSIALPITLKDKPQGVAEPIYCTVTEIEYRVEDSISTIIDKYNINAYYPTYVIDADSMAILSIISNKEDSLHGVRISYVLEEEQLIFIDLTIIPKTHILRQYEKYPSLQEQQKWQEYDIRFFVEYNSRRKMYDMKIYFTDNNGYDYFVDVESDEEIEATDILNILYN